MQKVENIDRNCLNPATEGISTEVPKVSNGVSKAFLTKKKEIEKLLQNKNIMDNLRKILLMQPSQINQIPEKYGFYRKPPPIESP